MTFTSKMKRRVILAPALCGVLALLTFVPGAGAQNSENAGQKWQAAGAEVAYQSPSGAPHAADELVVTMEPGVGQGSTKALSSSVGGEVKKSLPQLDSTVISLPEVEGSEAQRIMGETLTEVKRSLESNPYIRSVDYNYLRSPAYAPDDARFDAQYGLVDAKLPGAWDVAWGGADVAVVDTGIDSDHPDLSGKVVAEKDLSRPDSLGGAGVTDYVGHGTHVAGIAAANTDNGAGIAGACPGCGLINAKVAGFDGSYDSEIAEGITWAVDNGAEVVNVSLEGPERSAVLRNATEYAWNNGAIVVAAAGNQGTNTLTYPAGYSNVVGVAGTGKNERRASFSNSGKHVDVAAPGDNIVSTVPDGGYEAKSGTSMSSPLVAGVAGLMSSQGMTNDQILSRLQSTATPQGASGADPVYGAGMVDAAAALGAPADPGDSVGTGAPGNPNDSGTPDGSAAEFYTVRPDNTVYSIAERYGTTVESIAAWNDLDSAYTIHPGERLRVG